MPETEVTIGVEGAELAGTLTVPDGPPAPGVLFLGGTFSDLRDGDAEPRHRPDIPPHGMYRLLSDGLAEAGFAVLRFDRRGCGRSGGERPDRATEIADSHAAWKWLRAESSVDGGWAMVGESAGAYVLCRLVAEGARPRAAVLQGALYRSIVGLIEFNAARARRFWERGDSEREWMWQHARAEYESAVMGRDMATAVAEGRRSVRVLDDRGTFERSLESMDYDIAHPPAEQFRWLRCPTLILHGADDLNVPTEDAFDTARALWNAGNRQVDVVILARADHSLQATPPDEETRIRERLSYASFHRPFHARYPEVILEFLRGQRASELGEGGMV